MTSTFNKKLSLVVMLIGLVGFANLQAFELADTDADSYLVTVDNPNGPQYANAGANLRNGVGSIFVGFVETDPFGFLCTATAIGPRHILTAAHCVTESDEDIGDYTVSEVVFILSAGLDTPVIIDGVGFAVHPLYPLTQADLGTFAFGDIAVIELAEDIPGGTDTYELYTDFDEFNQETRHYGHGGYGKGNKGDTGPASFFYARTGLNMYEQTLGPFFGFDGQLLYDFDSGGRKHNAMAWWFSTAIKCGPEHENPPWAQDGQCTTFKDGNFPDFKGFRKMETGLGPGDSGGPGFIGDKIAGVQSFGFTHSCEGVTNGTDFTCGLDGSFGEMNGDTRVSFFADWVGDVVDGSFPITPIGAAPVSLSADSNASVVMTPTGKLLLENVYSANMNAMERMPK